MNAFVRTLHAAYGAVALLGVGTLAVLWFGWEPLLPAVAWLMGMDWFYVVEAVLLGIVGAGALAALVMAIVAPSRRRQLTVQRENGEVAVSRGALQSTVRNVVEAHSEFSLEKAQVNVQGKHNPRIFVHAKVKPDKIGDLGATGLRLQNEIGSTLEAFTGYPVESVDVTFVGDGAKASAHPTTAYKSADYAPRAAAGSTAASVYAPKAVSSHV